MPEYPYMQWFTNDWMGDPAVTRCSPVTRGIWFDFLNVMHQLGRTGVLSGTREQLARFGRCSAAELGRALDELKQHDAGLVTEENGVVTVVNRRMLKEAERRKSDAERQKRHRSRADGGGVTSMSQQNNAPHAYGCSDGDGSGEQQRKGGPGENPPVTPDDLEQIGDWLTRVAKVSPSLKVRDAVVQFRYTLEELKRLWQFCVNAPKIKNRQAFLISQITSGVKVPA
jgi:hypothetical protein